MCSVWTVCQSMPHKPLVKIGTEAPLPVLQRASSLQILTAEVGSCLWFLASHLSRSKQLLGITLAPWSSLAASQKWDLMNSWGEELKWKPFWSFHGLLLEGPIPFSRCQIFCIDYDPVFQCLFWCHSQRPYKCVPSSRPAGAFGVAGVFGGVCSWRLCFSKVAWIDLEF